MSFRKEMKSTLSSSKLFTLIRWIHSNGGNILYPDRLVNSVYFDNINLNMYNHSIEGVLPRKKIRLRIYKKENSLDIIKSAANLEHKISSVEGRFKISKKYINSQIDRRVTINDPDYGICSPKLNVIYKRTYYKIKNIRLTIDKDIIYRNIKHSKILPYKISDNLNVVELKYSNSNIESKIMNSFPFQFNRFSKYCRGIEFTQKRQCDEII